MKKCLKHRMCFFIGLITVLLCTFVQGQNITRPNISGPSGLMVNSFTGNLFYQRTDLVLPGLGYPIRLRFTYNSSERAKDQGFGYGWTFEYNRYYTTDSLGITMHNSDGRKDLFTVSGGQYISPKGIFDVLTQYSPGKFKLTTTDKTEYLFDDAGHKKLTGMKDRYGNTTSLAYNSNKLSQITDASGREVAFTWDTARVIKITSKAATPNRIYSYTYNTAGCLVSVKDPLSNTTNYTYGAGRVLSSMIDGNGNSSVITYNSSKAVIKLVSCQKEMTINYNPAQHKTYLIEKNVDKTIVTNYEFDTTGGRLIVKTGNCCGFKNSYFYDDHNNISKIIDANGNSTLYTYDSRGNLLSETDPLSRTVAYTYEPVFSKVKSITDKKGNTTQYVYDALGNMTSVQYPLGITVSYTYDSKGNRLTYTDGRNNTTTYTYDAYGYLQQSKNAANGITLFEHDNWGNITSHTDANTHKTLYTYDELNRLTKITDALNGVSLFAYDANGNLLSFTDARSNQTRYVYDGENNAISVLDAFNNVSIRTYDALRSISSVKDVNGRLSTYQYDHLNRLVAQANPAGERTLFEYDNNGNTTVVTYPNGNVAKLKYDALNRIIEVRDNLGLISATTYDDNSNKLTETDATGNTITYQYDALNRLLKQTDALGNARQYEYDANNNLLKETDRKDNVTTYTYDVLNRQTVQKDPLNFVTTYNFDAAGNMLSVTDARSNLTQYTYDALNRNILTKFADNTTKQYGYDVNGNLLSRKDNNGQTTNYAYDKLNRLLSKAYPTGVDSFAYDAAGQMRMAKNSTATILFNYDNAGRTISESLNGKTTGYTFNIVGGIKRITYPSGKIIERRTNTRNQLTAILNNGNPVLEQSYNANGQITNKKFGNNLQTDYSYNSNKNVTGITINPGRIVEIAYNYDKEENPLVAQLRHRPTVSEQYGYDKLNQLTSFVKGTQQSSYNYDGVGNRTTAQLNGLATTYTANSMNAYTSIAQATPVSISYDANGNTTNDGTKTYSYDYENRMTAVNNGTVASYKYDALGRRIQKNLPTDTTRYLFDGLQVIEERNSSDSLIANYVWGSWIDDLVSMQRNGQSYYYHANALGSVVAITDNAGTIAERYEYDAFGKADIYSGDYTLRTSSAIGNNYTYTGREFDGEIGSYYYRARQYDQAHGKFRQRDPTGYLDGLNIYAYVGNNPSSYFDPFGTFRYRQAGIALIGLGGNIAGTIAGVGIGAATSWTGVGAVVGGVIAVKSVYGVAANAANLWAAFNDEDGPSTGALFNDAARAIAPCNEGLQWAATGLDLLTDVGGLAATRAAARAATTKSGTTIVGEGMARVEAAASKMPGARTLNDMPAFTGNADQITSQMMQYNRQWILNEMRSGRTIMDIGYDVNRTNPSIFYQMEQNMLRNYQRLHPGTLNIVKP